jgi:hypothetical protein
MSPYDSEDLTVIVEERAGELIVYRSPGTSEHHPNYESIGTFSTLKETEIYCNDAPRNHTPNAGELGSTPPHDKQRRRFVTLQCMHPLLRLIFP